VKLLRVLAGLPGRLFGRVRDAREQKPGLRLAYVRMPIERRSTSLLARRLRELVPGAHADVIGEVGELNALLDAKTAEYYALAPEYEPGALHPAEATLLYGVVRSLRPSLVVETGTASGFSSAYLLAALERNGSGRLISIDLPFEGVPGGELRPVVPQTSIRLVDSSPVPPGKESGWVVPDELRGRWDLRIGDASQLLPALLAEVDEVDVFFHDSLHSREHMLFELETVWPRVARGGVVAADDIFQRRHDALPAFARSVGRPFTTFGKLGFVKK
jgi:predicted O-methyltransferase YrrM